MEKQTVEYWIRQLPEPIQSQLLVKADYFTLKEVTEGLLGAFLLIKRDIQFRGIENMDFWNKVEQMIVSDTIQEHPQVMAYRETTIEKFELKIYGNILETLYSLDGIFLNDSCKSLLKEKIEEVRNKIISIEPNYFSEFND